MKIAIYHNLPSGGAKRALFEWVKRLADAHSIDVYTLSTADHNYLDIRPFVQKYHIEQFTPHKLFKRPFGRLNQLQYWRNLRALEEIARQTAEKVHDSDYDVVFLNPCQYTFMPALAQYLNEPTVYYLHEPFGPTFQRTIQRPYTQPRTVSKYLPHVSWLKSLYQHRLERIRQQGLDRVNHLLANSEFTQQEMKLAYGVESTISLYGVDSAMFRPLPDVKKENYVISVGAMTPRKGFDFLIESLAEIPSAKRPLLKIASNGQVSEERKYIEILAVRYGVNIQLLANLDSTKLCLEYNKALLCVYSPVMEPFGLVPLESMACGTPVVGVAEGGVCESVKHQYTGLLADRNPKLFASAIQELLDDSSKRRAYGHQARDYVLNNWTWDCSTSNLEDYLLQTARSGT